MTSKIAALLALAVAPLASASPILQGNDFIANNGNAIPPETLLVAAYYDGNGTAQQGVQVDCGGRIEWLAHDIPVTGNIETFQYDLNGCTVTGLTGVRNVVANGVSDGVGYGLFWKDASGDTHIIRSNGIDRQIIVVVGDVAQVPAQVILPTAAQHFHFHIGGGEIAFDAIKV